jgi:uncharacterized membrane protein YhiD involved in acid resistance
VVCDCIGLAFGAGAIGIGLLCSLIAFLILYCLPIIDSPIQDDWYSELSVLLDTTASSIESIIAVLTSQKIKVKGIDIEGKRSEQRVTFHLKYKKGNLIRFPIEMSERVGKLPGV